MAGHVPVSFKDKLEVLLSWATTLLRSSDKRVHLVASTLSHVKHDYKKNGDEFQNILVGWLEQVESMEGGDLLVRLFSELSRRNIFSYGAYVQRMVAKGDTECDIVAGKVILSSLQCSYTYVEGYLYQHLRFYCQTLGTFRQVACRLY